MPAFPIVDSHLHVWDPTRTPIVWMEPGTVLARRFDVNDYARDCTGVEVEAMVFLECVVERGYYAEEIAFVAEQARVDPRIKAIVPQADLEDGRAVLDFLEPLVETYPSIRGVRKLIERNPDPELCLRPSFVEGVRALAELGLSFEVNVDHTQMANAVLFARQVESTPMILDHCGKPGVKDALLEPWRSNLRELAKLPNVYCKLSDLPVEADWRDWTTLELRPYVDAVIDAFGFDRVVYGGDWPVCLQATSLERWVRAVDETLAGCTDEELRKIYRDNAIRFYRLEL